MKIGILTFHRGINLGSVLQAYSTYKVLSGLFTDARVEIIDFVRLDRSFSIRQLFSKSFPCIRLDQPKRHVDYKRFLDSGVLLTTPCGALNEEELVKEINSMSFDYVFTGSDTVWMHSPKIQGGALPHIYFLPEGLNSKKASLSASVDPLKTLDAYRRQSPQLCRIFEDYSYISVRDRTTFGLLKDIGVKKEIFKTADPTFLHPFERDLGINFERRSFSKIHRVGVHVGKSSKRVVSLLRRAGYDAELLHSSVSWFRSQLLRDIEELARYDAVITSRFHFTIISLKLSNSFVGNVERIDECRQSVSKGQDLFEDIGLSEYFYQLKTGEERGFVDRLIEDFNQWNLQKCRERRSLVDDYIFRSRRDFNASISGLF